MKNYIGFVNDHSGSMSPLRFAAIKDYNANIEAVKHAANTEMLDTVVSVVGVGYPSGARTTRQVVVSNPHVLKPVTEWSVNGGTPLYDGIADMIDLLSNLPDANDPNVSFLVMITTDGEECSSVKYNKDTLRQLINKVSNTGRWTFAIRVPSRGISSAIRDIGIPIGNIQQWETSTAGLEKATQVQAQAVTSYYTARSAGLKASSAFYANAAAVDTSKLVNISSEISLYVVPSNLAGIEIRDFVLNYRMQYLKGAAFYQLTKTEARVQHTKLILVRDRATGKVYAGKEARGMIGLPTNQNARLHPGDHKNYDIFIQSTSVNRKLVGGTGVVYWEKIGVPFTEADLDYLKPKKDAVVQLPAVPVSNKPTPSPVAAKQAHKAPVGKVYANTRNDARKLVQASGGKLSVKDNGASAPAGTRWEIVQKS